MNTIQAAAALNIPRAQTTSLEPCWMCSGVERHTRDCTPPLGLRTNLELNWDEAF